MCSGLSSRSPPDIAYFNTATDVSAAAPGAGRRPDSRWTGRSRPWSIAAEDWFIDVDRLRGLFAAMIGANTEGIALVPSTSYGFAVAARNLPLAPADRGTGARRGISVRDLHLESGYPGGRCGHLTSIVNRARLGPTRFCWA